MDFANSRITRAPLLFALALVALGSSGCERAADPDPPRDASSQVVLLGLDGATWAVIGPMIERGQLRNFARLVQEGATMPHFETLESTDSAVVWTTVATGRDIADHGIFGSEEMLPNGDVVSVSSDSRRAVAVWEVASRYDVSVGVVNWWASWPSETVNGYWISDRARPAPANSRAADRRNSPPDPRRRARLHRDFYPLDLAPLLSEGWLPREDFPYADVQRRGRFTAQHMEAIRAAAWDERTPYSIFKSFYAADLPLMQAAIRLHRERPVHLQMIHLYGPDPVQRAAWDQVEPEKITRDRGLVEGVYRTLDALLGELLAVLGRDTWLVVASDHGADPDALASDPDRGANSGGQAQAADGVLFLRGPHVKVGAQLTAGDPADLAPTLLWLLDLPISDELIGAPLTEAFDPRFVASRPIRRVASYGSRNSRSGLPFAADEQTLGIVRPPATPRE